MLASKSLQAPIRPAPIRAPGLSRGHSLLVTAAQRKPSFHLQPPGGWTNDPNGVHYDAKTRLYHMFYQHHRTSSVWSWGLSWGHAVSEDLVHWSHLPPALDPSPGGADAGGVWSGCAFPTDEGTVLLHTAVRKRDETPESKLPPAELDLGHQVIESQQYAVSQPEKDPFLRDWEKGEKPLLPLPPQGGLTGWRDPFLVGRPGDGLHDKYTIIIGSGYMDEQKKEPSKGAVFVYTSDNPISGWKYEGELCHGDGRTGAVWECPLLARVENHPAYKGEAQPNEHILVVCPDNPHNTPVYFLGRYDPKTLKFDMDNASGPHPVDLGGGPLGSTFYAPNVLNNDPHGRLIMWGWCQETGRPGDPQVYDYGSCLSVPRLIWRHPHKPGVIWQEPLPDLSQLRREAWHLSGGDNGGTPYWTKITTEDGGDAAAVGSNGQGNGALANGNGLESANGNGTGANTNVPGSITPESRVDLKTGKPVALPVELGSHPHLELELTLEPPTTLPIGVSAKTGIIIRSNEIVPMTLHEASGRNGAALLYDWRHARLEVVFSDGMEDLEALCSAPAVTYDIMNSTSRVYLTSHDAQAGEATQPDSVLNMSAYKEGQENPEAPHCQIIHDEDTAAQGSAAPLHSAHGMSGRSGSAASDHDAEHQPLDVRGCHAVGGQLELWPGMDANTNGGPSNNDNSELAQASRSGMQASKAAVDGKLQPIKLRVFLDHSMLEAFTSTGQVLTTRVYHHEVEDHPLDLFDRAAAAAAATSRPKSPAYQVREPTPEGTIASIQAKEEASKSPPADGHEKSPEPAVVTSTGPTEVVFANEAREKSPEAREESPEQPIPLAGRARSPSQASEGSPNNGAPDLPPSLELAAFGVDSGMSGVAGYKLAPIWQEDKITDDMEARARDNFSKAGARQQQVKVGA